MFAISVVKGAEQLEMIKLPVQYFSAVALHLLGDTEMPYWHYKWSSEVPILATLAHNMQTKIIHHRPTAEFVLSYTLAESGEEKAQRRERQKRRGNMEEIDR